MKNGTRVNVFRRESASSNWKWIVTGVVSSSTSHGATVIGGSDICAAEGVEGGVNEWFSFDSPRCRIVPI